MTAVATSRLICSTLMALISVAVGSRAYAQANPDTGVVGVCVGNCNIPTGNQSNGPPQPSPDELRRMHDEQDLQEATDDAIDRGVAAFKRGEYSTAIRKFEEALVYDPDNALARQNLANARSKLSQQNGLATRQSVAAAAGQTDAMFDGRNGGTDLGGISAGTGAVAGTIVGDPVVPPERMTPKIAGYEAQRKQRRERIAAIDTEIAKLDATSQGSNVAKLKQERSQAESEITFLNFSIETELKAPPKPKTK